MHTRFFAEMDSLAVDFGNVIPRLEVRKRSGCVRNRLRNLDKAPMVLVDMDTESSKFRII